MENNKLLHSGIKGMRWGIRRWQNKDGSLTPAGRKRYADNLSEEEASKIREEGKQKAIKSGDIDRVGKHRGDMTNDELRKALDRVDLEQKYEKKQSEINKSGFDKTMDVVDKIGKVKNAADTLVNVYNLAAKINNSFNTKFQLKEIDGKTREVVDAYKEKLVNTATAREVMENVNNLNAKELQTATTRLENINKIKGWAKDDNSYQININDALDENKKNKK